MVSMEEIGVKLFGEDGLSNMLERNAGLIDRIGHNAKNMGSSVESSMKHSAASVEQAKSTMEHYNQSVVANKNQILGGLNPALMGLDVNAHIAKNRFHELGTTTSNSFTKLRAHANHALSGIRGAASSAIRELGGMDSMISRLIGGFGALQAASMMWSGATEREFNKAYLKMQLGEEKANEMVGTINKLVAALPGDDTMLNNLLGAAAARKASVQELEHLGHVAADYAMAGKKLGVNKLEVEQDLNAYILTGNTGELERSRIVAGQVDKLKNKATVAERTKALEEAMTVNQLSGLSSLETASTKWEEVQGRIQLAATELGSRILPYVSKFLDFMIWLDRATNGFSTQILFIAGALAAVAVVLAPIAFIFKGVGKSIGGLVKRALEFLGLFGKKKTFEVGCKVDSACNATDLDLEPDRKTGKDAKKGKKGKSGGSKGRSKGAGGILSKIGGKFGGILGNLGGSLRGLLGVGGAGGILSKIGGAGGILGKLGGLAAGAARFAGPIGLAITAATAGYGAYTGWTETQGPWQEKAKGAVGGAVEKLSMGIINKKQVMDGINWLQKTIQNLPNMIKGAIGSVVNAFKNIWSYLSNIDWAAMIGNAASSLLNIQETIQNGIMSAMEGIDEWISSMLSSQIEEGVGGGAVTGSGEKGGKKAGKSILDGLGNWITTNGPRILGMLGKTFFKMIPLLGKIIIKANMLFYGMLSGLIMSALGRLKGIILQSMSDAWNNAKQVVNNAINGIIGFIRSLPGRARNLLVAFGNSVKQKIKDAWNNAQKTVSNAIGNIIGFIGGLPGRAWGSLVSFGESVKGRIGDAWNSAKNIVTGRINDIMSAITGLPGRAASALSNFVGVVKGKMLDALGPAKDFVCKIIGCSPGILPALRQLAAETPYYIGSVIPHMEKLNNTLNAPFNPKYVDMLSGFPVDDLYGSVDLDLKSNIPVLDMDNGIPHPPNISKYTVHETGHHVHHHAPITVDARDITRNEFKSLLIDILEGAKK